VIAEIVRAGLTTKPGVELKNFARFYMSPGKPEASFMVLKELRTHERYAI
jgi:hypothetical protein